MTQELSVKSLVGVPYVPRGRDLRGLDCWGLVLEVCGRMNWPMPPDYAGDPDKRLQIVRLMKHHKKHWANVPRSDGCVGLIGGDIPHHAGIAIAGGILHSSRACGVEYVPIEHPLFINSEWYAWL